MSNRKYIRTERAPKAIGAYSQAVRYKQTVWISGQIPLDPVSMEVIGNSDSDEGVRSQIVQVFANLKCICEDSGGSLRGVVKLNIFLTDMSHFHLVNEVMETVFEKPYPARAAVGVLSLPRNVCIEAEAIMVIANEV